MRILLIDVNCNVGSTGKITFDLYSGVNAAGNEAAICYGRGPLVQGKNIYKFGLNWETYIHALLTRLTGWTGCFSYFSTKRLLKFIDAFKPDMVHIHELHAYFVNLSPLLKYLSERGIPVVWTFHCEFMYTGKCGYAYECESWRSSCGRCPYLRDYPKSFLFDHTMAMQRQKKELLRGLRELTIVTPSQWLADRVGQSFLAERDVRVIHNGIDTDIFHPRDTKGLRERYNIGEDEKVILAVAPGIMAERKGGEWVLRLAELMQRERVRFILIGADKTKTSHPRNTIILPRTANQIELAEFYSLADVFVICSKRENFPTTCIEAQCCGTPVCGFDTGGTAETAEGLGGIFVDHGDIDALRAAAQKLLSAPHNRKELAMAAAERYSKDNMVSQYLRIYNSKGNAVEQ